MASIFDRLYARALEFYPDGRASPTDFRLLSVLGARDLTFFWRLPPGEEGFCFARYRQVNQALKVIEPDGWSVAEGFHSLLARVASKLVTAEQPTGIVLSSNYRPPTQSEVRDLFACDWDVKEAFIYSFLVHHHPNEPLCLPAQGSRLLGEVLPSRVLFIGQS